jgi:7-cyano-7-deazaguanine synthase
MSQPQTPAAVVLLSGGLDSTVLLHWVARRLNRAPLSVLSFDYGQKHAIELTAARWQCARLPQVIKHQVLPLGFFAELLGGASALVDGGPPVPALAELEEAVRQQPPTYVPNRNMVLLSLAAAFAEACGASTIFYGAQAQDEYGYWDCTQTFIETINRTLALNRRHPVQVEAPFASWRKSEIVRLGTSLGVDFSHTWSCYRGETRPCGVCPTCCERATAFREAGETDPLEPTPSA